MFCQSSCSTMKYCILSMKSFIFCIPSLWLFDSKCVFIPDRSSDWHAGAVQLQWHHTRFQNQGFHWLGVVWEGIVGACALDPGPRNTDHAPSWKCALLFCACKYMRTPSVILFSVFYHAYTFQIDISFVTVLCL